MWNARPLKPTVLDFWSLGWHITCVSAIPSRATFRGNNANDFQLEIIRCGRASTPHYYRFCNTFQKISLPLLLSRIFGPVAYFYMKRQYASLSLNSTWFYYEYYACHLIHYQVNLNFEYCQVSMTKPAPCTDRSKNNTFVLREAMAFCASTLRVTIEFCWELWLLLWLNHKKVSKDQGEESLLYFCPLFSQNHFRWIYSIQDPVSSRLGPCDVRTGIGMLCRPSRQGAQYQQSIVMYCVNLL